MEKNYLEADYLKMNDLLVKSNFHDFKKQHLLGMSLLATNRRLKMNILHLYGYKIAKINIEKFPPLEFIKYLIDNGIEINSQDVDGLTPLHYSIDKTHNHLELNIALTKLGAKVDIKNKRGQTPLWDAVVHFRGEEIFRSIIKNLIQSGASIDEKNDGGNSPRTHIETIRKAISQGGSKKEWDLSFILDFHKE